jgi:hypothetical protein
MARHESQAKRLSDLVEEFRVTLIQELRSEIEGNASSYFLRKEPFVRDGRRYKDERVAYLEGLEREMLPNCTSGSVTRRAAPLWMPWASSCIDSIRRLFAVANESPLRKSSSCG